MFKKYFLSQLFSVFCLMNVTLSVWSEDKASVPAAVKTESSADEDFEDEYEDNTPKVSISDPFKPMNKAIFNFNDKFFLWVVNPAAKGYARVMPESGRVCVRNFFSNIFSPVSIVNTLFQGKFRQSGTLLARLGINTTLGILGLFDPAKKKFNLELYEEDFGQTLGSYKVKSGFYLVIPFLGPSSVRDGMGILVDLFFNPLSLLHGWEPYAAHSVKIVNNASLNLGSYETIKKSALDPYDSFKDIYLQYREEKIKH